MTYIENPIAYMEAMNGLKYACKYCGHKSMIPHQRDKVICSYCHHYVFKNARAEFEYKLREEMKKCKR